MLRLIEVRMFAAVAMLVVPMATVVSAEIGVDVGRAEIRAEGFTAEFGRHDDFTIDAHSASEQVGLLSVGVGIDLAGIPMGLSAFITDSSSFWEQYPGPDIEGEPPTGVAVRYDLRARGARLAAQPKLPLGAGWAIDGLLGIQYTEVRRSHDGQLVGTARTRSDTGIVGGAGVSYAFAPRTSIRAGVEFADRYRAATLGLRYSFD